MIVSANRRSNAIVAANGAAAGLPYASGSNSLTGTARRERARAAGPIRAHVCPLEPDSHRPRRLHEADVEAAAGGDRERDVRELRRVVELGAVDREHAKRCSRDREAVTEAVRVDQTKANRRSCGDSSTPRGVVSVQGRDAVERVHGDGEVGAGRARARLDDEHAEEAAPDLLRGDLVRVVPERPDLLRSESVGVALAREDGVLRHAGHAVLGVRDVDAVPVDRDALLDVLVPEHHFDVVALSHAKLRAWRSAVERQSRDRPTRRQADRRRPRLSSKRASGSVTLAPCRSATLSPPRPVARHAPRARSPPPKSCVPYDMTLYVPGIRCPTTPSRCTARTPTRRTMPAIAATRIRRCEPSTCRDASHAAALQGHA